jgi:hypothetical protein
MALSYLWLVRDAGLCGTPTTFRHPVARGSRSVGEWNRQRHRQSMQKDGHGAFVNCSR